MSDTAGRSRICKWRVGERASHHAVDERETAMIGPTFQKGDDPDMKPNPGPHGRLRRWLKNVWKVLSYPAHPLPFDPRLFDDEPSARR